MGKGYSVDERINGVWEFYKVSSVNIFDEYDSDTVRNLNVLYEQVDIKVDNTFLKIRNSLLSEKDICSIKYRQTKETPLFYFHSDATVSMYVNLFRQEGFSLAKYISILRASEQSETCSSIYSEIIESDDYLVLIDHYYAVFFKKIDSSILANENHSNGFLDYCKDANPSKEFDGGDKYFCEFVKKNIYESYSKLREMSTFGKLMKESLSKDNLKYVIQDGVINYQWKSPEILKVTIFHGVETVMYEFQEKKSGTHLVITVDTGY